ncbi:MAG: 50S ribosomal protein L9 [Acidobacteria bacterium]|nr:50S ribosomal protein L9 [Acidobacteriota bacterium]
MATDQVILKQDVRSLGDRGDIVTVAAGYARNYLFPKSLAMPATAANKKQLDEMRAAAAREAAKLRGDASKLADTLQGAKVRVVTRAGDSGQLFGSVTSRDIADGLEKQGFPIDRHKILLEKPIKETGDYDIRIHLYKDVKQSIRLEVRAEGREDELFGEAKAKAQAEAMAAEKAAMEAQAAANAKVAAEQAAAAAAAAEPVDGDEIDALEDAADKEGLV